MFRRLRVLVTACACATYVVTPWPALTQTLPDPVQSLPWVVDGGYVEASAAVGDMLVVGGNFRTVARRADIIGPFGAFDAVSARLVAADPSLAGGAVTAAVDDGAGGWYLAGSFIVGNDLGGLIHVDATGRRLPFLPALGAGYYNIHALARAGTVLFVGGTFTQLGGAPRQNTAAIDLATASLLPWSAPTNGAVEELHVSGASVFLAGAFTDVGGQPRSYLASVDATTGAVLGWAPQLGLGFRGVTALALTADRVFAGGDFAEAGGMPVRALAAFDRASGARLPFNATVEGSLTLVEAIGLSGSTLVVGGRFDRVGGQDRSGLAAVDAVTGVVTAWAPAVSGTTWAVGIQGGQVFVGGDLRVAAGARTLLRIDASTGAVSDLWQPAPGNEVRVLLAASGRVLAGGLFSTHRARPARGLTGFSFSSGAWRPLPEVDGLVRAFAASGTTLFIGGGFSHVGGHIRQAIAAVEIPSGTVLPLAPTPESPTFGSPIFTGVEALAVEGTTLYFAGGFTHVNGQPRPNLAAVDAVTGVLRAFEPPPPGGSNIGGLVAAHGRVWIGGGIGTTAPAPARNWLVVYDAQTGAVSPLDFGLDRRVFRLARDGDDLYLAGEFTRVGGAGRPGVAKIDLVSGQVYPWPASTLTDATDITAGEGLVVTAASAAGLPGLQALDALAGVLQPWAPNGAEGFGRVWSVPGAVVAAGPRFGSPPPAPALLLRRPQGGAPAAVAGFNALTQGTQVTLRWTPALQGAFPTSYRLDAGSSPGASDVARVALGAVPSLVADVPPGRYFVRVTPRANGVDGPASPEIAFVSGVAGCAVAPEAPQLAVSGSVPTLQWTSPGADAPSGYELRAGASPDALVIRLPLPGSVTAYSTAGAPPGDYFVAVVATSPCGVSAPSNVVRVVVAAPGTPAPPTALAATVNGTTVSLSWTPPAGAITGYVLEAGSAPGLANIVAGLALGPTPSFATTNVPPGTYYVRVRAANGALVSAPSSEIVVTVP